MQALRNVTAVFCIACICAGALTQLAGSGWPSRCIKAAAGLYILVVLIHALPGLKTELSSFSAPQASSFDFGTVQDSILRQAQTQLEQTIAAQCFEETGVMPCLQLTLMQMGTEVSVSQAKAELPVSCTEQQRESAVNFLRQALGVEPELVSGEGRT